MFTPGCNLKCPYCHNSELVLPPFPESMISLDELDLFLKKRAAVLGGVCITGGEPLIHEDIGELIRMIRSHVLRVKLDTNGTLPDRLQQVEVDYIAMDLKTDPDRYDLLLPQGPNPGDKEAGSAGRALRRSVNWLRSSGIDYELRTTFAPGIVGEKELQAMLPLLQGAKRYVLTPYRPGRTLDPGYSETPAPDYAQMERFLKIAETSGVPCVLNAGP